MNIEYHDSIHGIELYNYDTPKYYTETQNGVLIAEVSSIQRSPKTLLYYIGMQNGVLIIEVSAFHRSLCTYCVINSDIPCIVYLQVLSMYHRLRNSLMRSGTN